MVPLSDVFVLFMSKTKPGDGTDCFVGYSFLSAEFMISAFALFHKTSNTISLIFICRPINFLFRLSCLA